ncbi:hypothetical protein Sste5344_009860 [Sporothrix stenoceras]
MPDLSLPRFTTMKKQTPYEYAKEFIEGGKPPWFHGLFLHWKRLLKEPYTGISNDGTIRPGIFDLHDDGIPIASIVLATEDLISILSESQRQKLCYHIDSSEWRTWSNPEFLLSDKGIRLEEITPEQRTAVMMILQVTLSPEGYEKAVGAMRVNGFLGDLVESPNIMNEFSYNFVLFGEPSVDTPWGLSFYGHHLCLNIFFYKTQIAISPWFTGAEPNLIDDGPYNGTQILYREEALGLELMQSLPVAKQETSQVYKLMKDPTMPWGRWNHDDQRHLCGAYRDNRIIPYEGILVSELELAQQGLIIAICREFLSYLPTRALENRLEQIMGWFHETYWCWIGGFGDEDPFYYRIQSPVVIIEFDHHSGVFLDNKEPAKFHIHTLLRTPNGGDYGMALRQLIPRLKQEYEWEG